MHICKGSDCEAWTLARTRMIGASPAEESAFVAGWHVHAEAHRASTELAKTPTCVHVWLPTFAPGYRCTLCHEEYKIPTCEHGRAARHDDCPGPPSEPEHDSKTCRCPHGCNAPAPTPSASTLQEQFRAWMTSLSWIGWPKKSAYTEQEHWMERAFMAGARVQVPQFRELTITQERLYDVRKKGIK